MHTDKGLGAMRGFTLIELMVTAVIVAILAAIAYPAYTGYVQRGNVPQATAALLLSQVAMEQYFQDNRSYLGAGTANGCPPASTANFTFTCTITGANNDLVAIAASGTGSMSGFTYIIDQAGNKSSTTPWGNSSSCWVRSPGGVC